jgi:7-carboxy-7-deazaguanine synthase
MTYSVKEIYYTLQGEGANAGRPAVFLRFSGCNLWSGLPEGRVKGPGGCSRWCDTDFVGTDGPGGGKFATAKELAESARRHWSHEGADGNAFVVCTGGEPLLQLDSELISQLHDVGFQIAVETNGTIEPPCGIDWLTVSPKANSQLMVRRGQELKLVYPQSTLSPTNFESLEFKYHFLQPLDGPHKDSNTKAALDYCLAHPKWRLSLQTHKLIGIP